MMLSNLTLRTKVLVGIAVSCAGYVAMMPDPAHTIEAVRSTGSAHAIRPAAMSSNSPMIQASLSLANRIVKDTAAASLFAPHSWYVAPPPPPPAPVIVQAPPVPTAPPLPFAFMGSYRPEGSVPIYFLTAGDRVYDVKIGDTLDNTYTVDGVKSGQLLLTYVPLKIQQSLAVGDE